MTRDGQAVADPHEAEDLFVALDRYIASSNYRRIIVTADQILANEPGDRDALVCKVVALIQDGNTAEALSVIDSSPDDIDFSFHKAYCLNRQNKLSEALEILKRLERSSEVLQLEAQILYKMGDFESCINSYETLLQTFGTESDEVKSNVIAAYVSAKRSGEVAKRMVAMKANPRNLSELAYNAACAMIDRREFSDAEDHLLLARRIGQETLLEKEYSNEEIEDELAPVTAQLAYVQQVQGKVDEAAEGYSSLSKRELTDSITGAVVCNNLVAIRWAKGEEECVKEIESLLSDTKHLKFTPILDQKLSAAQKQAIIFNYFLLLLNKSDQQAREMVEVVREMVERRGVCGVGLSNEEVDGLEMMRGEECGGGEGMMMMIEEKKKKKRKRKIRYPKGYDPQNPGPPPDPERWLPKRERSSYRPKKKDKRAAAAARGSQGSIAISNGPSSSHSSSSAASTSTAGPSRPSSSSSSSQRNKKKGRR